MDIQPVKRHTPPALPMQHEFDPCTLNEGGDSFHWQHTARLAGAVAALQWGGSASAEEGIPPAKVEQVEGAKQKDSEGKMQHQQLEAVVIPLLEEALSSDGRGAFGCVAINPPAFLAEDEALDLIRKEFAKAGLTFDDGPLAVSNISRPETVSYNVVKRDKKGKPLRDAEGNWVRESLSSHSPETFSFDLAFNAGKIRVEFIGREDYSSWNKPTGSWCSVSSYDFADVAMRFRDNLASQSDLEGGVYGIFFDPLARFEEQPAYPRTQGLGAIERKQAWAAYGAKIKKLGDEMGRERLQKQIDYFLGELKSKQIID